MNQDPHGRGALSQAENEGSGPRGGSPTPQDDNKIANETPSSQQSSIRVEPGQVTGDIALRSLPRQQDDAGGRARGLALESKFRQFSCTWALAFVTALLCVFSIVYAYAVLLNLGSLSVFTRLPGETVLTVNLISQ